MKTSRGITMKDAKLLARVGAVIGFVGVAAVIIGVVGVVVTVGNSGVTGSVAVANFVAHSPFLSFTRTVDNVMGIASISAGVWLLMQFSKLKLPKAGAILLLVAGFFQLILVYVSLVLWIISAIMLLRIKFVDQPELTEI